MVLEKVNAIADWRALIGPTDSGMAKVTHPQRLLFFLIPNVILCGSVLSDFIEIQHILTISILTWVFFICSIRAMCGLDKQRNCVHGSDSPQSAAREISFFTTKSLTGQVKF